MNRPVVFRTLIACSIVTFVAAWIYAAIPPAVTMEVPSLATMVERVAPAVVNISVTHRTERAYHPYYDNPDVRRFFGLPDIPRFNDRSSAGSGVIIDADKGYVVTNHHMVGQAYNVTITLIDQRTLEAELVGSDPRTDIALLKVEAQDLAELTLSSSDSLRVGDFVVAIGNPFGLGQSVTSGIVSALSRHPMQSSNYEDFIQTDASINPGNSGGALLNLRGEFIGINTAIWGPTGANIGVGFAIPSTMAKAVIDQLIEYGNVQRGVFGITGRTLTPQLAEHFGLGVTSGVHIETVKQKSEAEASGVEVGDIVTSVNGKKIEAWEDFRNVVGVMRIGDRFEFTVVRDDKTLKKEGGIAEDDIYIAMNQGVFEGVMLTEIPDDHVLHDRVSGVLVESIDETSRSYRAGLRRDDVIVQINEERIQSLDDMITADLNSRPVHVGFVRGTRRHQVGIY